MAIRNISPNLALNELVARRIASGESIVHLGFGEPRLPVFEELSSRLLAGAENNFYGPVAGYPAARMATAGYFSRRRMPTSYEQIVFGPGSKPLLLALQSVLPGDLLLVKPCWVSYAPQALHAGKSVFPVPAPQECGGVPDPDALIETINTARASGHTPRIVILTSPDNPTGTSASPALIRSLCTIAKREKLIIISDEIYRDLIHDPNAETTSPAELAPERTIVVSGLSKSLALGGWRIGVARFPASEWGERVRDNVLSFASEAWTTLAGPMQEVAAYAFSEPPALRTRLAADVKLHRTVARKIYEILIEAGASCRPPTGGFYVYPDFELMRDVLKFHGATDSYSLQHVLIDQFGIAVLAGAHFGDSAQSLTFRAATSMLYGQTKAEQLVALGADDPLTVPHIAEVLARLEEGFTKLVLS